MWGECIKVEVDREDLQIETMAYTYEYNPTINTYNPTYYPVPPPHTYPSPNPMAPTYIHAVVPPGVYPTAASARVYVPQRFPYVPFNPAYTYNTTFCVATQHNAFNPTYYPARPPHTYPSPYPIAPNYNHAVVPPGVYPTAASAHEPQEVHNPGHAFVHQQSRTIRARAERPQIRWKPKLCTIQELPEPLTTPPPGVRIFVKNLHYSVDDQRLREEFRQFGRVTHAEVVLKNDHSLGFGFVSFSSPEEATKAIKEMNGKMLMNRRLFVELAQTKEERRAFLAMQQHVVPVSDGATGSDRATYAAVAKARAPPKATEQKNNKSTAQKPQVPQKTEVIVKNLEYAVDDKQLHEKFMPFGTVTSAKVVMKDGHSRGFGFVCFSSLQEANKAITEMNQRRVGRRPMRVELVQSKEERQAYFAQQEKRRMESRDAAVASERAPKPRKRTTVIIKNLDFAVDSKQLHEKFMSFGTVISAKVVMKDDHSRGFGFVTFSSPEEANKAIKEMSDKMMGKRPVIVELVQSKAERDAFLAGQEQQKMKSRTQSGIFPLSFEHSTLLYTYCRKPTVDKPQPSTVSERTTVIVRNLDLTVDDKELRKTFLQFGTVMTAKVAMVKGCPKGHGIVTFQFPDEAEKAVKEMNGKILGMKALQLSLQTE